MKRSLADMPLSVPNTSPQEGKRLIYLMGASGSGKDTLLRHLSAMLEVDEPILIAHRYITRASGPDEASIALSESDFKRRLELGCFALHWHSHGLFYGVGIEIDTWLNRHAVVIINGSRKHLAKAVARYPKLQAVEVTANAETLAKRLAQRGRETTEQIQARLQQAQENYCVPAFCTITRLPNNTHPDDAAQHLYETANQLLDIPA